MIDIKISLITINKIFWQVTALTNTCIYRFAKVGAISSTYNGVKSSLSHVIRMSRV